MARGTSGGGARIDVADTGAGIPESELKRALKPFEQLDNRLCRSRGGAGLGLTLVQGLVALHKGRLDITSTPGMGSTVTAWLPPGPEADSLAIWGRVVSSRGGRGGAVGPVACHCQLRGAGGRPAQLYRSKSRGFVLVVPLIQTCCGSARGYFALGGE